MGRRAFLRRFCRAGVGAERLENRSIKPNFDGASRDQAGENAPKRGPKGRSLDTQPAPHLAFAPKPLHGVRTARARTVKTALGCGFAALLSCEIILPKVQK